MRNLFIIFILSFGLLSVAFADVIPIKEVFEPKASDYPASIYGKVAVVQWAPSGWAPLTQDKQIIDAWKQKNKDVLKKYIEEAVANGAKMVITPEFGIVGYPDIPELPDEDDNFTKPEEIAPYAEAIPGKSTQFFANLAKKHNIYIHFGFAEKSKKSNGKEVYHNTVVVLNPKGEIAASYRKIHLYQIEVNYLEPGTEITVYNNEYFGKIGIVICSDIYGHFPMNQYAKAKLDVMALSTSWAQYNSGWSAFTRGATWVKAYLLAANQNYFPDSGVIEPTGKAQSHIRQTTGIAYGYLPLK